jgi:hypothetical protein
MSFSLASNVARTIRNIFTKFTVRRVVFGLGLAAAFALTAFAAHHNIGDACRQADKVNVTESASYVIYYNSQNFPVQIEDLAGEKNRKICQMDPAGSGCSPGYCQISVLGVNYCKKC